MTISPRGYLDVRPGESVIVRLTSTATWTPVDGRAELRLGARRQFHFMAKSHRTVYCEGPELCRFCSKGMRQLVRFRVPLLVEGPSGLEGPRIAWLTKREHREFLAIAQVIEGERRDPTQVRLLWRHPARRPRTVEVRILQ